MRDGTYNVHKLSSNEPQSAANETNFIGKACTYFVDAIALQIMSKLPERELQCDLRLVRTADDLVFAVMASASEPTYYFPVADFDPNNPNVQMSKAHIDAATDPFWRQRSPDSKEIINALQSRHDSLKKIDANQRYFVGGFLMSSPAQDLRRAMPHLYVIGTGRRKLPNVANDLLRAFFLIDTNKMYQLNRWWTDFEVQPSEIEEKKSEKMSIPISEVLMNGEAAAIKCLSSEPRLSSTGEASCAPQIDKDELDTRYDFLILNPNAEFSRAVDGTKITETARPIPGHWLSK